MASEPALTRRRVDLPVAIALVAVWGLLWVATVPLGDIPLNDDWTYALAVKSLLETGRFSLLPWSTANAFAQVYWGALFGKLFGFSYETLRVSTAVLGAAGVVATYGLLRSLGAAVAVAALGALTVGCNPLYLSLSVTFMTDVPFATLVTLSLWSYAIYLRRERVSAGWAAYAAGFVAVLVRQFAVVLPVAFAVAAVRRRRVSARLAAVLGLSVVAFAGLHLGYQNWMVATGRTSGFESPVSALLHVDVGLVGRRLRTVLLPVAGMLGMALMPFAAIDPGRVWPREGRAAWRVTFALAGVLLVALFARNGIPPLLGNVVESFGIGPLTLTDTYSLRSRQPDMPGAVWFWLLVSLGACWGGAMGLVAAVVLVAAVLRGGRVGSEAQGQAALVLGFIAAYGGAVVAFVMIAPLFDRYLLPLQAPVVALIVLATRGRGRGRAELGLGFALVAGMAAFSVLGTHDWLAWQRTRWEAVRLLESRSVPAASVDGGYEFNGVRTYRPVDPHDGGKPGWWVVDNAYVIAAGPMAGYREIARFPVATWLWETAQIVVLQRAEGGG